MFNEKRIKGNLGEDLAVKYLQKHGYKILDRNFHCRFGEIDIIAQDGQTLVFVEVKTRWSKKFGEPQEAITFKKLRSIIKTMQYFLLLYPKSPRDIRIDVVSIDLGGKFPKLNLIKNVSN